MSTANAVPVERSRFKRLLAENLNYFGNLENTQLKPVKKIVATRTSKKSAVLATTRPHKTLEATIAIKQPFGYGTDVAFRDRRIRPVLVDTEADLRMPTRQRAGLRHPQYERLCGRAGEASDLQCQPAVSESEGALLAPSGAAACAGHSLVAVDSTSGRGQRRLAFPVWATLRNATCKSSPGHFPPFLSSGRN